MRQRATWGKSRTKVEEARELLAGVMLAHVPVILNNSKHVKITVVPRSNVPVASCVLWFVN